MTHDHKRNGTVDLFAAMNVATGEVLHDTRGSHAGADVLAFFKWIDIHVPRDLDVHVVLDNLSAHKSEPVRTWLAHPKRARWHLHFTPTSASWLNLIEGWFSVLTRKALINASTVSVVVSSEARWHNSAGAGNLCAMTPAELAQELGVSPKRLRDWLRANFPQAALEKSQRWVLDAACVDAARAHPRAQAVTAPVAAPAAVHVGSNDASLEARVADFMAAPLHDRRCSGVRRRSSRR